MSTIKADIKRHIEGIEDLARQNNTSKEAITLAWMQANRSKLESYLLKNGITPVDNLPLMAAQLYALHVSKVEQFAGSSYSGYGDFSDAESDYFIALEEAQLRGEEPEEFLSEALSIAKDLGTKVVEKINQKKDEKGKKRLFESKKKFQARTVAQLPKLTIQQTAFPPATIPQTTGQALLKGLKTSLPPVETIAQNIGNQITAMQQGRQDSTAGSGGVFGDAVNETVQQYKARETKKAIMQYLPFIIAGVILIWVIARKTK